MAMTRSSHLYIFNLAGYLLICSSQPGTQPANLQGKMERQNQSTMGQQVHDQHQHGNELLACGDYSTS